MQRSRGFTIVELLVVIAIISALLGVLLPAVNRGRDQAKVTQSQANLRGLATAHATYSSEWNGRQFTLTRDDLVSYIPDDAGEFTSNDPITAVENYNQRHGKYPPPIELGWAAIPGSPNQGLRMLKIQPAFPSNYSMIAPIMFEGAFGDETDIPKMGYFRLPNARQFSQYLNGRFYDPVFYAPKDAIVMDMLDDTRDLPGEYLPVSQMIPFGWENKDFCYASYSTSPAALFSPEVMSRNDPDDPTLNGWVDPWTIPASLRAPGFSQARYAGLKTHMLEHHWLQSSPGGCNARMPQGQSEQERRLRPYKNCQPHFFNHGWESAPVTLFFDGHIDLLGVRSAQRSDSLVNAQSGDGLWRRDTPFGEDGYWSEWAKDDALTSFHILTTDGIRGRDKTEG